MYGVFGKGVIILDRCQTLEASILKDFGCVVLHLYRNMKKRIVCQLITSNGKLSFG